MALTRLAHKVLAEHFQDKDKKLAIDATLGNGHDFEFLVRLGFEQVVGFDIQQSAIDISKQRLVEAEMSSQNGLKMVLDSHANMGKYVDDKIDCCMFNLGYLPNGDKEITTQTQSSLAAIDFVLDNLRQEGIVSLLCYPGHPQGEQESDAIEAYLQKLDTDILSRTHRSNSPNPKAPILHILTRP